MTIRVGIHHKTVYKFDRLVELAPHQIRLRPAPHTRTPVHKYSIKVLPEDHFINWQQDPFGNFIGRYVFEKKTRELVIEVDLVVDMVTINPFDFFVEEYADQFPFEYEPQLKKELAPYFEIREDGPLLNEWIEQVGELRTDHIVYYLVDLNHKLQKDIGYVIRMEPGVQTCEETLERRKGSCRDTAWLLVQIMRHMGLAARFVSGYLVQLTPDVKSLDGPSGPEEDFTDLHAWAEVYVPGAGWLGLDPTSGLFAGEGHIPLACTPDPVSAAPVTGAVDKCEVEFEFENSVTRIHEDPRVTKPYTDEQWQAVMALGAQIDAELKANDVRLTMGGEPTFVSIDDMDGDEWNINALGPHKRERAEVLFRRLWKQFGEGGVLHHGQGKWYPGEPLPRWALACFWRDDAVPVWGKPELIADPMQTGSCTDEQAEQFSQILARQIGIASSHIVPGFEDALYYLWKEGTLPKNLNVLDNKLTNKIDRDRLRRVFAQGLDRTVGYALPLAWDPVEQQWVSSQWEFSREHMFLLPGDSPMGFRLPLDSLLWEKESERHKPLDADPFAVRENLPGAVSDRYTRIESRALNCDERIEQGIADEDDCTSGFFVRTAICVEPRDGNLHVFLPPITHLNHWLELIGHIETTAAELQQPVILEGYEAPHDDRLKRFSVTPDPGVIEVNIHPSSNWQELVNNTEVLYEEAHQSRLGTEKFMLDGRHTGTGGGNHVTLGGPSPADSPLLRRPELLSSLIRYWQNHPSLSYLFSGMFIGPTSQAPRVDEARDDSLYELEIALQQIPVGDTPSPWIIDRVMRNLLVDMTGNTHRAEFCIDKLYAPNSPTGRLGIVEFRGFEMPPHARMSVAQNLLLRTLVSRFWDTPYEEKPVRWGTELHDRFMLPHYVERDFADVVSDLRRWGYGVEEDWFAPFTEFRFPHYGRINIDDIEVELRFAIEPWHVLGEEITAQGTSRFVDSSVERMQVKVRGMTEGRHLVACNGQVLPLRNTGEKSEYVAGVRYKAWDPVSGMHPTLPIDSPLVFDVVDRWAKRSLGGCTYHVVHPGGRSHETLPINAYEAESRRLARFSPTGHTGGKLRVKHKRVNPDHPYTLDLRYSDS
jgi:uncharacterized protein (DUF2126 family)/transglutaminase-like putative cysteine protease